MQDYLYLEEIIRKEYYEDNVMRKYNIINAYNYEAIYIDKFELFHL